jgi:hypothetical protein
MKNNISYLIITGMLATATALPAATIIVETDITAGMGTTGTITPNVQYVVTIDDSADTGAIFTGTLTLTGLQGTAPGTSGVLNNTVNGVVMSSDGSQQKDLTFAISGLSETTATGATIDFDGFVEFFSGNGAADGSKLYSLNGAAGTPLNAITGWNSLGLDSNPTVSAHNSVIANFRIEDVRSQFTITAAVPEPSSTALLGLGGLALMLRRKRS